MSWGTFLLGALYGFAVCFLFLWYWLIRPMGRQLRSGEAQSQERGPNA